MSTAPFVSNPTATMRTEAEPRNAAPLHTNLALFTDSPVFAGTERHLFELARAMRAHVDGIVVACPGEGILARKARAEGIAVLPLTPEGAIDGRVVAALARRLRDGEIDLIHAHNGRSALRATLAILRAGRGRCVFTQHFLQPDHTTQHGPKARVFQVAHRWMYRRIDRIIAVSEAARRGMIERKEAAESKITVVPNGIPDPLEETLRPRSLMRQELGIDPSTPLIACVARLQREKDLPDLVRAMDEVARVHPEAVCVILGDGDQLETLTQLIAELRLQQRVRLLGYREDPHSIVHAADLFVLPSRAEPFGLAILEAMALSRPVIATAAGGPLEIVEPQRTGLLVRPSDPSALARAIGDLLCNPALCTDFGRRGRQRYEEHFSCTRMALATREVYRIALAGPG
jgi:glycosyltransferase involved in cell wall biosynthesis